MLPDEALLEIFNFYVNDEEARLDVWHTLGPRVPKVAIRRASITESPRPTTCVHRKKIHDGGAGRLAMPTHSDTAMGFIQQRPPNVVGCA